LGFFDIAARHRSPFAKCIVTADTGRQSRVPGCMRVKWAGLQVPIAAAPVHLALSTPYERITLTVPLFGLYPQSDFRVTDGHCRDCPTIPQALWYFEHETIAVPKPGMPVAGFTRGVDVAADLRGWLAARAAGNPPEYPPLVWIGAPQVVAGARLTADTTALEALDAPPRVELVPKIPLNRSYFDASSARFFHGRAVKIRGTIGGDTIVARTLWPEDFRLDRTPPTRTLAPDLPATLALRALMRSDASGGARSPFGAWTLWRREPEHAALPPGRARSASWSMARKATTTKPTAATSRS
jgi:hypothetical protein